MFRHKHPAFKALRDTVAFVVFCAALEWYVSHTDGAEAAAAFRTVWPTLAFCCSCGALLVYWAGAALPLRVSALFSAMGMALQVSLHPANATELKLFCLLAFVGCICTVIVFALLRVMPQTVVYTFCIIASVVSFLFLRVFSKPINSTYAWVSVAGHSFQLTEALKLILVIGFSAAVTNDAWNEGVRFRAALLLLAVYAGGFFVLNELGTLLVCLLDCGVMALLYCSIKRTLSLVAFGALTGGVGYAFFLKLCSGMQNPAGPFRLGQLVYRKLAVRLHYFGISDFSTLSSKEVSSSAYQAYTTWRSLLLARPMGASPYRVSTPVADSDLILATLANRGGWICLLLALLGTFLLILASLLLSTRCGGWLSCVGTGAGCAVGLAGLVNLFSTASLLLIGVQFPFLGAGGSSFICSWAAITLLLCSTIPTRQGSRELLAASQITEEDVS